MWCVKRRGLEDKTWVEMGEVAGLNEAAQIILKQEASADGALFLRLYVDPVGAITGSTDAELLSRLEYKSEKNFYLLTRTLN